jgi:hypothetical protein
MMRQMTYKIIHGIRKNFDLKKTVPREFLEDLDVGVMTLSGGVCNGLFTVGIGTGLGLL